MEIRRIACNVRSTLNNSYPGKSTKMLLVPSQTAYALTAARLPMRWTLAPLIPTKRLELTHQNLSESNIAKSQRVSYSYVPFCPFRAEILIQRISGSPIQTKGYTTELNDTNPTETDYGDLLLQYNYGPISGVSNYTYQYDVRNSLLSNGYSLT